FAARCPPRHRTREPPWERSARASPARSPTRGTPLGAALRPARATVAVRALARHPPAARTSRSSAGSTSAALPASIRSAIARAQAATPSASTPWGASAPYSATRSAPRRSRRAAPTVFPRCACVTPTATWASPRHSSRCGPSTDFHTASSTSWAWKAYPSSSSRWASRSPSVGENSASSGTRGTPGAPYGSGRPYRSRGRWFCARPSALRSRSRLCCVIGKPLHKQCIHLVGAFLVREVPRALHQPQPVGRAYVPLQSVRCRRQDEGVRNTVHVQRGDRTGLTHALQVTIAVRAEPGPEQPPVILHRAVGHQGDLERFPETLLRLRIRPTRARPGTQRLGHCLRVAGDQAAFRQHRHLQAEQLPQ